MRLRPVDVPTMAANTTCLRADTRWELVMEFDESLFHTREYWRAEVRRARENTKR